MPEISSMEIRRKNSRKEYWSIENLSKSILPLIKVDNCLVGLIIRQFYTKRISDEMY